MKQGTHWTATKRGIRWTTEERDIIIGLVVREFADSKDALTDTMIFHSICNAQQVFSKERQRPIKGPSNFPALIDHIRDAVVSYRAEHRFDRVAPTAAPVANLTTQDITGSFSSLISQLLDLAVDKLAERVAAKIQNPATNTSKLAEEIFSMFEQRGYVLTSTDPSPSVPEVVAQTETDSCPKAEPDTPDFYSVPDWVPVKPMLPKIEPVPVAKPNRAARIGVLGLFDHQHVIIARKYPNINFRFYTRGYPKNAAHVDYLIGMTGFMRHGTDEKAIKQFGSRYVRITGSLTQLERKIAELHSAYLGASQ